MRSATLLASLIVAAASAPALASPPSYDYLQIDYVGVNRDDPSFNYQGADFQISGMIVPYLILNASYQYLESGHFQLGALEGRVDQQTVTAGLETRLPLVYNQLDAFLGADFVYAAFRWHQGFEGVSG